MLDRRARLLGGYGGALGSLVGLLGLALVLTGCGRGGGSGSVEPPSGRTAPTARSTALEEAAVGELRNLYCTALLQEDIDQLQSLLHDDGGAFAKSFLDAMAADFRRFTITDLQLTEIAMQRAAEPFTVSFRETRSMEDPQALTQQTRSQQTTWQLVRETAASGTVTILIGAVTHAGPQFAVTTRGRVQAGVPTPVEVTETSGTFAITTVEVEVPETGTRMTLVAEEGGFQGRFTPPSLPHPQALQVRIHGSQGAEVVVAHRYRLRLPGEGAVEVSATAGTTPLFGIALGLDGTVWAGGEAESPGTIGTLVQVAGDGQTRLRTAQPSLTALPPVGGGAHRRSRHRPARARARALHCRP
jgi:hypothetical protein